MPLNSRRTAIHGLALFRRGSPSMATLFVYGVRCAHGLTLKGRFPRKRATTRKRATLKLWAIHGPKFAQRGQSALIGRSGDHLPKFQQHSKTQSTEAASNFFQNVNICQYFRFNDTPRKPIITYQNSHRKTTAFYSFRKSLARALATPKSPETHPARPPIY